MNCAICGHDANLHHDVPQGDGCMAPVVIGGRPDYCRCVMFIYPDKAPE